jgi:type IV pilus assembly protein PilF
LTQEPQTVSVSDDDYAKREAELAAAFDTGVTDVFEQSDSVADKAEVQTQAQTKEPDITNDNTEELIPEDVAQVETLNSVSEPVFHVVLPKENLYQISLRYNVQMKYLMEWNELDDASSIRIGTKLWVKDPNNND